jgi:hypothetical protein
MKSIFCVVVVALSSLLVSMVDLVDELGDIGTREIGPHSSADGATEVIRGLRPGRWRCRE